MDNTNGDPVQELKDLVSEVDNYLKDLEARGVELEKTVAADLKTHLTAAKDAVIKQAGETESDVEKAADAAEAPSEQAQPANGTDTAAPTA